MPGLHGFATVLDSVLAKPEDDIGSTVCTDRSTGAYGLNTSPSVSSNMVSTAMYELLGQKGETLLMKKSQYVVDRIIQHLIQNDMIISAVRWYTYPHRRTPRNSHNVC